MPSLNKEKSQLYAESFFCKNLTSKCQAWMKKERVEKFAL